MGARAEDLVRSALAGTGLDVVGSAGVAAYDARAPEAYRSAVLLDGARGLIVVGSAGPTLWRRLRERMDPEPARWGEPHPLDRFVRSLLDRADAALAGAGVRFRRFEAAFDAEPRMPFATLAQIAGLGSPGPFGMLIHPVHGAWWALRGSYLVDTEVADAPRSRPACEGCAAPCVGGWHNAEGVPRATVEARSRCVVGQASRYDDDQIAYHYDRMVILERLRRGAAPTGSR
ncbi:MAG: hypothetical protein JOZ69_16205 [Myxococcales bacterium]|nr:hypothetical protein [Myxococcales bacterium]